MRRTALDQERIEAHRMMAVEPQREPAARRYAQTHALAAGSVLNLERDEVNEQPDDGVAALRYDGKEARLNALRTPAGRAAAVGLSQNACARIGVPNPPMFAGEAHILAGG